MPERLFAPDGAWTLGSMILSCGEIDSCHVMLDRLKGVTCNVPFRSIGEKPDGSWYNPFRSVHEFLEERMPKITVIGAYEVAATFGSSIHAEAKLRDQVSTIKSLMGPDLGFLLHVGMPLEEDLAYRNKGLTLRVRELVEVGSEGTPFSHLGAVVRLPLTEEQVSKILDDQASCGAFMEALAKYDGQTIELPHKYVEATRMNCKKAAWA